MATESAAAYATLRAAAVAADAVLGVGISTAGGYRLGVQ
jgi:hypothetical protein